MTDAKHEAPAEGAGDEAFCEAYYDAHLTHAWAALRDGVPYQVNADGAIGLIQQAAADRRAVKAWQMTARSSAPEAREGEVAWLYETVSGTKTASVEPLSHINGDKVYGTPLYTHPAAPSADKLRIAVEALERIGTVDMGGGFLGALACRQVANQALADLKAEGA